MMSVLVFSLTSIRLYVAVSRPRSQLYVVDTDQGKKNLWRFAESPTALKNLQKSVPHSQVWDEHLEPLQEGTSEHLDSDFEYNPEELAEKFEKTGLAECDASMMNYAAQYYQECKGKNEKVVECLAMGLLFNKDYVGAAKKFTEMSNFIKAGDCWWEYGKKEGWDAMEKLAAHDPMMLMDPKYPVARALSQGKQESAASALEKLLKKIKESGAEKFQTEKWVAAVTALVNLAISKSGNIPADTMKAILFLVESGVCRSSEKFAEAMLANGDVQMAKRFYEFAGVSKGAKYQRTMFVTTKYPECLAYYNIDDEKTRKETIEYYLKNKEDDLPESAWRFAVASAFIKESRVSDVIDVIATINDPTVLRTLAGYIENKKWKAKVLCAADVMSLRARSPEVIAQAVVTHFDNDDNPWFWLRVLARVAGSKTGKLEGDTLPVLGLHLRELYVRWRKAQLTAEERECILPIGEFGLVLEKFGSSADAASLYKWHYYLTKDTLAARRWFELQTHALTQRHGSEASNLRAEIEKFARESGMSPRNNRSSAALFGFDWDSLLKALFINPEEKSEVKHVENNGEENKLDAPKKAGVALEQHKEPLKEEPNANQNDASKDSGQTSRAEQKNVSEPQAESQVEPPVGSSIESHVKTEVDVIKTDPPVVRVADALKLTFFSAKGRLNIEDQESGSQWNINANGVSIDGESKGHVTKMKIEGTSFSVTTSAVQIILSDDRCGYEFTIKL